MTIIYNISQETDSTVNSTEWASVVSGNWNKARDDVDTYFVFIYFEYTIANKNQSVQVRVLADGVEQATDIYTPPFNNQFTSFSTIIIQSLGQGTHTLSVEARGTSTDTITIRRKRMVVMQR